MAKVDWSAGIDSVSGALAKPSKSGQHSCIKMLLGTHRIAASTSNDCNRLYMRKKTHRATPPSSNETNARLRFAGVSALVRARKNDLAKVSTDQEAFYAQKDNADGAKTLNAYYWLICGQEYDASLQG